MATVVLTLLGSPWAGIHAQSHDSHDRASHASRQHVVHTPGNPQTEPATRESSGAGRAARLHREVHHARLWLAPELAFRHIERANRQLAKALAEQAFENGLGGPRPRKIAMPEPTRRPTGAGRYLAAVWHCADADLNVPELLAQHREDLLLLSSAGPRVTTGDLELIDQMIERENLSLCIVLTHADCRAVNQYGSHRPGPAMLLDPRERARHLASHVLRATKTGVAKQRLGRFEVVAGVVEPDGKIHWIAPFTRRPRLTSATGTDPSRRTDEGQPIPSINLPPQRATPAPSQLGRTPSRTDGRTEARPHH